MFKRVLAVTALAFSMVAHADLCDVARKGAIVGQQWVLAGVTPEQATATLNDVWMPVAQQSGVSPQAWRYAVTGIQIAYDMESDATPEAVGEYVYKECVRGGA